MVIDTARALALQIDGHEVDVERGRLRAFARAIGETDPVWTDLEVARAAGHPDLPVPPTFFFSLDLESTDPLGWVGRLGADLRGLLHGEQTFTYHGCLHAGETVTVRPRITEAYAKNERMDFVVKHTEYLREGELVAEADTLLVLRQVRS